MKKLYSNINCPFAQRARIALAHSAIKYHLIEVDFSNKPRDLLEYSPKGTVPVLVLENGTIIDESIDIVNYAKFENSELWEEVSITEQQLYLTNFNEQFISNFRNYKTLPKDLIARNKCEEFLKLIEEKLTYSNYIYGNKLSTIEVIIIPFIQRFTKVDEDWWSKSSYKQIENWIDSITTI